MDSTTFGAVGAAYAVALGAGLLRARGRGAAVALLALFCAGVGLAIAAIVGQHDPRLAALEGPLERVETTVTLLCGPMLFLYFRAALTHGLPRRSDLLHATPAAASLLVPAPIEIVVLHQVAYTAGSAWLAARNRDAAIDAFHRVATRGLLAFFGAVHLAQAVRFGWSGVTALRNVVPVVAAAVILLLGLGLALRGEPVGRLLPRYRNSSLAAAEARRCLERLDLLMAEELPFRDPSLSLATLAGRLDVSPHHLSQSLNQQRGTTLTDYLAVWRVEEAKIQLLDRGRDHLTIDAIAESAGFGSRSAFYSAFRRIAGSAPSDLRRRS